MPVPKFLIYQPDENAPAGAIQDELSSLRCASTLVRCDKHQPASFDPEVYSGLIVLGGGKKSADTRGRYVTEKNCTHQAVTHGKPVFGVCLRAQLLALECGGGQRRSTCIVDKGWKNVILTRAGTTDPVLKHLKQGERMYQYHYDWSILPTTTAIKELAKSSDAGVEHCEAFRFGNSYGVQFHPEVTKEILDAWKVKELPEDSLRTGRRMINAWIRLAIGEVAA